MSIYRTFHDFPVQSTIVSRTDTYENFEIELTTIDYSNSNTGSRVFKHIAEITDIDTGDSISKTFVGVTNTQDVFDWINEQIIRGLK